MKEKREKEKYKKNSKRSLLISSQEVKKVMLSQKSIFIAFPTKTFRSESVVDSPKCLENLVKEFEDVFQHPPKGLPPLRGIEHQIDFIPGASLPNRQAYRTNPIEAKEIQ